MMFSLCALPNAGSATRVRQPLRVEEVAARMASQGTHSRNLVYRRNQKQTREVLLSAFFLSDSSIVLEWGPPFQHVL